MKKNKFFFIVGFIREIFHTTLFVYLSIIILPTNFLWLGQNITFILLLSAGYLIIPAAYLAVLYDDTKFYPLIQLLQLAKILRIIMAFLIGLMEILEGHYLLIPFSLFSFDRFILIAVIFILFFDLIFLYFLLSFKGERKLVIQQEDTMISKVFEETEVRNEFLKGADDDNPSHS